MTNRLWLLAAVALACGEDAPPTLPDTTPASLEIASGNSQTGTVSLLATDSLAVRVANAGDDPLSGVTVDWSVLTGGGTAGSPSSNSNASGLAAVSYRYGPSAGVNVVQARVRNTTLTATFDLFADDPLSSRAGGRVPR